MKYVIAFNPNTATLRCHASTCKAATFVEGRCHVDHDQTFDTVQAAFDYALEDERERTAGDPALVTKPYGWKVCNCAKGA
jgi:hypothetical protein